MSDEGIMENYHNISENCSMIGRLEKKIEMLDARILKLEEIIVELANVEPDEPPYTVFTIEELAEIALENRANEDRGEDR